jgi:hypothetical protein
MDARIIENEMRIRANVRQYRDRKAISSKIENSRNRRSNAHWLKGLNNALLMIIGRL